jgi:hypothetical protein
MSSGVKAGKCLLGALPASALFRFREEVFAMRKLYVIRRGISLCCFVEIEGGRAHRWVAKKADYGKAKLVGNSPVVDIPIPLTDGEKKQIEAAIRANPNAADSPVGDFTIRYSRPILFPVYAFENREKSDTKGIPYLWLFQLGPDAPPESIPIFSKPEKVVKGRPGPAFKMIELDSATFI